MSDQKWIVCKFGGTSVSSRNTWNVIVEHAKSLTQQGFKVCIVVSAVSQVTNHLEKVVNGLEKECPHGQHQKQLRQKHLALRSVASNSALSSMGNKPDGAADGSAEVREAMEWLLNRHQQHCKDLDVDFGKISPYIDELRRLVEGIRLTGDAASARLRARVLGFGELMSSCIGESVLARELEGLNVKLIDARDILVSTGKMSRNAAGSQTTKGPLNEADKFLNADVTPTKIDFDSAGNEPPSEDMSSYSNYDARAQFFANADVVITQGFIARTPDGQTCVLGRGGSDTSGALFASVLSAARLEIWTDVNGMYSSDPRFVPNARLIKELSYREAQELAAMGAKVLHPRCLGPASWGNIPVEIRNTMKPQGPDELTRIVSPSDLAEGSKSTVMAITRRVGQVLLTISTVDMWGESGFLSRVFAPFQRFDISVDLIATSQYAVSMTLDYIPDGIHGEPFSNLLQALEEQGDVHVETDCAVVSIVGRKLRSVLHGMADAFRELERYNILLLSESTEDLNMSFVLGNCQTVDDLVAKLHAVLLEDKSITPTQPEPAQVPVKQPTASPQAADPMPSPGFGPTSPLRKSRSISMGSSSYLSASMITQSPHLQAVTSNTFLQASKHDPAFWVHQELEKYKALNEPFAVIDLSLVRRVAPQLKVFSCTWSNQPAVIKAIFEENNKVVFLCRTIEQIIRVRSIVGAGIRVHVPTAAPAAGPFSQALPDGVNLIVEPPSEEFINTSNHLLGSTRVIVSSIIDDDGQGTVTIDVWFQPKSAQPITILNHVEDHVTNVQSLSPHEDVMSSLFHLEPNRQTTTQQMPIPYIFMLGVSSLPFSTKTQKKIDEYIRF